MITFDVYQQFPPIKLGVQDLDGTELYAANLVHVGTVDAKSGESAMATVKQWPRFRILSGLGRFPIIEDRELIKRQEREALLATYDRVAA